MVIVVIGGCLKVIKLLICKLFDPITTPITTRSPW
jgi:hypothetical protein